MFCFGGKRSSSRVIERGNTFKTVEQTYRICTFLLCVGMMYPNPRTDKMRHIAIFVVSMLCLPVLTLIANDIQIRMKDGDIENLVRQMIVVVSVSFSIIKAILTLIYKKDMREIFDSISADYMGYNDLPEDYHETVEQSIKQTRLMESAWTMILLSAAIAFPASAVALNIYSLFFTDTPRRYMIHEFYIWDLPAETVYSTPIYEILFVYTLFVIFVIFVDFTAFDGMFSICVFHASLKIKILSIKVKHLLDDKSDLVMIKSKIAEVIMDQYEIYNFISKLIKCYNVWLVMMFTASIIQIGMALIQITSKNQSGSGASFVYLLFVGSSVAHIFFPCYLCSDVTYTASQLTDAVYSIPWEDVRNPGIRRSICFILARTQIPIKITALNLLTFDMNMFVSVLQTAYSMFTLLRS